MIFWSTFSALYGIYLGPSVPTCVIFIYLVSQEFILTDIVHESRGVLVSPVGKPCFESAIIVVTTLLYVHLVP